MSLTCTAESDARKEMVDPVTTTLLERVKSALKIDSGSDLSGKSEEDKKVEDDLGERALRGIKLFEEFETEFPTKKGKLTSCDEREKKKMKATSLVYGEINFVPFARALKKIEKLGGLAPGKDQMFVDLGSGVGKACFAASLLYQFEQILGIEYLESLHKLSLNAKTRWCEMAGGLIKSHPKSLQFVRGDFLQFDWSRADVCFANSTCFSYDLMSSIAKCASKMKIGSFFVTFTKELESRSDTWEVLDSTRYRMSWGPATVFIQKKVA